MKFMMSSVLTPSPLDESCSFIVYKASRSCLWILPPLDLLIVHDHSQSLISDHRELLSIRPLIYSSAYSRPISEYAGMSAGLSFIFINPRSQSSLVSSTIIIGSQNFLIEDHMHVCACAQAVALCGPEQGVYLCLVPHFAWTPSTNGSTATVGLL